MENFLGGSATGSTMYIQLCEKKEITARANLFGKERCKGLELSDIPFIEGKEKFLKPLVRCLI
jgi:hypothetical protein